LGKNSKIDFSLARNTIVVWAKHLQSRHWAKRLRSGWQALQCVYDFSLARNTIVVWAIQSCHWAKHLRSSWQALQCVGTKQITSVHALSGNFFIIPFLTVSDVGPKPCDA